MTSIGTPVQYMDDNGKVHPGLISGMDENNTVLSILWWDEAGHQGNSPGLVNDDTQTQPNSWTLAS
jgi:hypothetical protein